MNKLFLFILILLISACTCNSPDVKVAEDGSVQIKENLVEGVDVDAILRARADLLPNMCDLIPISFVAETLGLDESLVTNRNIIPGGAIPNHKTCFFKWNDPNFPNTGIMIQAMRNPLSDEMPEYITAYMTAKRESGENALGEEFVHRFKDLDGIANEGLYNADIGKYFWRFSDLVIFQLAFNTLHEQEEQLKIATILGKKMTQNYLGLN